MAQVYDRISNPFTYAGLGGQTNAPSPAYAPGEMGCAFSDQNTGNTYLRVYLDSGATSAAGAGAVVAGQLAYWKNRSLNLVTNDFNFNDTGTPASAVDRVAGIFQTAVKTAPGTNDAYGNPVQYICDLLIAGKAVPVRAVQGATAIPGAAVIADGSNQSTGGVKSVASVTTAPTQQVLGTCLSNTVTGLATGPGTLLVDVSIGFIV